MIAQEKKHGGMILRQFLQTVDSVSEIGTSSLLIA
jgi:hypothetical protein